MQSIVYLNDREVKDGLNSKRRKIRDKVWKV